VALPLPSTAVPLFANAAGRGYYRVAYTAQQNAALAAAIGQLLPAERICLVGDRWALLATQAAVQPRDATADSVTDVLELLLAMRNDPSPEVLDTVASRLRAIDDQIVSSQDRDRYHAVLRAAFRPVFAALGPSSPRDPFDRQMLRTHLLELLGEAQDADALAEAQTVAAHVLAPRRRAYTGVDPMFADAAVALAAEHGDAALYDRMQALTQAVADPDLQSDALRLLARFQSPLLVIRTLDYAVSGQVKNQDSWSLIAELLRNRQTSALAWEYVQQHWPQVKAQLTTNSGGHIVAATGGFCTPQLRDEVADFFASHPVEAADRTLALTLESIDSCIRVRAVQQPQLHAWLLLHAPSGLSQ
ncbi:MAG: ERAP1-like C-terminal domain-containing protein, partial [Acidobacteriota bacterium]|nr:ERAP1-like C-terminal domain-containing protein [Acidobacteriota bacterium]